MLNKDYRKYYNLERYLFEDVTTRYHINRSLDAFDFFCIIVWKANRAKSKVAHRLMSPERGKLATEFSSLEKAIRALTESIARAENDEMRMRILVEDWGFRLPMASAILTVLYPDQFSVYDTRVCSMVNGYRNIQDLTGFTLLWTEYQGYIAAVRKAVKGNNSLRDKDRWLWGKSFAEQLIKDISVQFKNKQRELSRDQ